MFYSNLFCLLSPSDIEKYLVIVYKKIAVSAASSVTDELVGVHFIHMQIEFKTGVPVSESPV